MKKSLCAIFLLCVLCGLSFAGAQDGIFYSANKLYDEGKYAEAADEYKKIIGMGYESGPVYYNLGNCYFKTGSLGKTILYYEKAKRLISNDPELVFNYNYVRSLLVDKFETTRDNIFIRYFKKIAGILAFGKWLGFVLGFWLLFAVIMILYIFTPGKRRILKYFLTGAAVLFIFGVLCAFAQYNEYSSKIAVVLPKEVVVRYGPGDAEVEAFLLHEGTKVMVRKEMDKWLQIQLPNGESGWMPKDAVEAIN